LIEFADPERVRCLLMAPNARVVRKRKTQAIVAILLEPYRDDSRLHARGGNPQKLFHNGETPENPHGVWTFQKAGDTGRRIKQAHSPRPPHRFGQHLQSPVTLL
jgi:hypothetical protein